MHVHAHAHKNASVHTNKIRKHHHFRQISTQTERKCIVRVQDGIDNTLANGASVMLEGWYKTILLQKSQKTSRRGNDAWHGAAPESGRVEQK